MQEFDLAKRILERHEQMKARRQHWNTSWELISEYVRSRKRGFTHQYAPGQFLSGKIFDSTAAKSNHKMASSLLGSLYPNSSRTFELSPPFNLPGRDTEQVKQYYGHISKVQGHAMDHPAAGLQSTLMEVLEDLGAFGTSGVNTIDTKRYNDPVAYRSTDVKHSCIDESADDYVDVVYIEKQFTVRQLVQEYGMQDISAETKDLYENEKYNEVIMVLQAIEPRLQNRPEVQGNRNMPIQSVHIEVRNKHVLRESGFEEMPVTMARFWKESGEVYGRSPAFEAIPDILEANAVREAVIVAIEKHLDPPLVVYHDGTLGGGVIDTSAGALNVLNVNGHTPQSNRAIEQLITVGELNSTYKHLLELHQIIEDNFFIDRLLDLNNDTRMTAFETDVRDKLRGQSLGSIYGRVITELFNPIIQRTFNILLRRGHMGVIEGSEDHARAMEFGQEPLIIPEPVAKAMMHGEEVYDIMYTSPAARVMRQDELLGIKATLDLATQISTVRPDVVDGIDVDVTLKDIQELTGAPNHMIYGADRTQQQREARAQQQAQAAQMQAEAEKAKTMKDMGLAVQAAAKAGIPPEMLGA